VSNYCFIWASFYNTMPNLHCWWERAHYMTHFQGLRPFSAIWVSMPNEGKLFIDYHNRNWHKSLNMLILCHINLHISRLIHFFRKCIVNTMPNLHCWWERAHCMTHFQGLCPFSAIWVSMPLNTNLPVFSS
jgi:hypothetical protein